MVEDDIRAALGPLVADEVYPSVAPDGAGEPRITYHWVGGKPLNFLEGVPDLRNGRLQVDVWAQFDQDAARIIRLAEDALRLSPVLRATTEGGALSEHEADTKLYARKQTFSIWFKD